MTKAPAQFGVTDGAINNDNQFHITLITDKEVKTICKQLILRVITAEYWIRNCIGCTEVFVSTTCTNRAQNV